MNGIVNFNHPMFGELRTTITDGDGEPWFVAKDVAEALGYANTADAIRSHCKAASAIAIHDGRQNREMSIIPERDLYRLVMRSKLPKAEKFEEWVVGEVLPSIRKTGAYATTPGPIQIEPVQQTQPIQSGFPASLPEVLRVLADELESRDKIIAEREATIRKLQRPRTHVVKAQHVMLPEVEPSKAYVRVIDLLWLGEVFVLRGVVRLQAGRRLADLSKKLGYKVKIVDRKQFPQGRNAYHPNVVKVFKQQLVDQPHILKKYRIKGAA